MSSSSPHTEWILAIDTSSEEAGLALSNGTRSCELNWRAGRDQTVTTLAEIDHLLTLTGIAIDQVGAVAVATGPGMFNGLRVGMSIAKGLHLAHGTPLIGIPTLEFTANPFRDLAPVVVATVAAGRGRLVWQVFPGMPTPRNGTVLELATALSSLPTGTIVVGELADEQAVALRERSTAIIPAPSLRGRRPGTLAALGLARWRENRFDDPVTLGPIYVHTGAAVSRG